MDEQIIGADECICGELLWPLLKPWVYLSTPECGTVGHQAPPAVIRRYPAPAGVLAPNPESSSASRAALEWVYLEAEIRICLRP